MPSTAIGTGEPKMNILTAATRKVLGLVERARSKLERSQAREAPELLEFWREHGRAWARADASPDDLARVSDAAKTGRPALARESFQRFWNSAFDLETGAPEWSLIPGVLPDAAYLAFAQGAAEIARRSASDA